MATKNQTSTVPSARFNEKALKISEALKVIQDGLCKRVDVDDHIKVYECANIIRIDIKW